MDRNQKAGIIALILVIILIPIAIGLLVYEIRTAELPSLRLPDISLPHWSRPQETAAPTFDLTPPSPPQITPPQVSIPSISTPEIPQVSKPKTSAPVLTPPPLQISYESVLFGSYEQGNGKTPIEWFVLEEQDDRVLLISRYALDTQQYHGAAGSVTWETCDLRTWLNTTFLNAAFSPEERVAILETEVDNSQGNPIFQIDGGNDTQDLVFLLSREEVEQYFPTEGERLCQPTAPIKRLSLMGYCSWWLRSPGYRQDLAEYVNGNGAFLSGSADRILTAVRPVIRVDLNLLTDTRLS